MPRSVRPPALLQRLVREDSGAVMVYATLIASTMIGIGVLSIDVGRLTTLHSQLQSAADAAALAGARELDLTDDSQARARAAVAQALSNVKDFSSDDGRAVTISTRACSGAEDTDCIRFLSALPENDTDEVTAAYESTDPKDTSFIEVRVAQAGFTAMFAGILGGNTESQLTARAIAGNDSLMCAVPPMFMCNPTELNPTLDLEGRQIELFMQGGTGQYGPGNFGLLCPSGTEGQTNCGGSGVAGSLASTTGTCMRRRAMTTKTGVTLQMVRTGVNARFDWWLPQAKDDNGNWRDQDIYKPAVNVTQGRKPPNNTAGGSTKCERSENDPGEPVELPKDTCIENGTCTEANGRIGDGNWPYWDYFAANHGGDGTPSFRPIGWPAGAPVTRYNVYRYEIETGHIPEYGDPDCFQGEPPVNDYTYLDDFERDLELLKDRRIMPIALANCVANGMSGKTTFSPDGFAFVFMTEPMGSPSSSALYVEYLGELDGEAQQALLRDVVQIYRR